MAQEITFKGGLEVKIVDGGNVVTIPLAIEMRKGVSKVEELPSAIAAAFKTALDMITNKLDATIALQKQVEELVATNGALKARITSLEAPKVEDKPALMREEPTPPPDTFPTKRSSRRS